VPPKAWVLLYAALTVAMQALLLLLIQRLRRWPLGYLLGTDLGLAVANLLDQF